jgi:serine/threonine-protein kinase RsbW
MRMRMSPSLPRDPTSVAVARQALDRILGVVGVHNDCRGEIALAVSEACTNAVQHAHGDRTYELHVATDDGQCSIIINDNSRQTAAPRPGSMPLATATPDAAWPLCK